MKQRKISSVPSDAEVEEFLKKPDVPSDQEVESFLAEDKETPETRMLQSGGEVLQTIGEAAAFPGAVVRSGVISAQEGKSPLAGVKQLVTDIGEEGSSAVQKYSGEKIAENIGITGEYAKPLAGFAAEVITDPLSYPAGWLSKLVVGRGATNVAAKQASKSIANFVSKSQYTKGGVSPELLGNYIVDRGLSKYLNNPKKLREVISGETVITEKGPEGSKIFKFSAPTKKPGMISGLYSDLKNKLTSYADVPTRSLGDIAGETIEEYAQRMKTDYSFPQDPDTLAKIQENVKKYLKLQPGEQHLDTVLPIDKLNDIRTMLNKRLTSDEFFNPKIADRGIALEKDVIKTLLSKLGTEIETSLDAAGKVVQTGQKGVMPASEYYKAQNSAISKLITLESILKPELLDSLKAADISQILSQALVGGAIGLGVGQIFEFPVKGAMVGGTLFAARRGMDVARERTPGMIASGSAMTKKVAAPMGAMGQEAVIQSMGGPENENFRAPQGMDNIPEALVRTPIPRDSQGILEKKEFVKAKIAQMYPAMYEHVADVLDNSPEYIEDLLPLLAMQMPGIFPKDKYNRLDGKIYNPVDRRRAIKDTMNDEKFTNVQKAKIISKLNKTGEF